MSTSCVERSFVANADAPLHAADQLISKKLENHRAAISLWIAFYNLRRVHETLRCTPAMALGVADHIWTIGELVAAALEPSDVPPLPRPTPETTLKPGYRVGAAPGMVPHGPPGSGQGVFPIPALRA